MNDFPDIRLEHLTRPQQMCFRFIEDALKRAGIELRMATPEQKETEMKNSWNGDFLWFSSRHGEFLNTFVKALNNKGLVASSLNAQPFNVVHIDRHPFKGEWPEALDEGKRWLDDRNNLPDYITVNRGCINQYTCHVSSGAREKMLSAASFNNSKDAAGIGAHLAVALNLQRILDNSIDAEIHVDYSKDEDGKRSAQKISGADMLVHRLYCAIEIDGEIYRVKTTLKEFIDESIRPYTFEIQSTELTPERLDIRQKAAIPRGNDSEKSSVAGAKILINTRKSYDSDKLLLDESAKVAENMSPLFIHQRNMAKTIGARQLYGWAKGRTVYITEDGIRPGTPLHEYSHLWAKALQHTNPEGWQSIVKRLRTSPLWERIKNDNNYATIIHDDNKLASEVLARLSEFNGFNKMEAIANMTSDETALRETLDRESDTLAAFWR